jgi:hypothetical protein
MVMRKDKDDRFTKHNLNNKPIRKEYKTKSRRKYLKRLGPGLKKTTTSIPDSVVEITVTAPPT